MGVVTQNFSARSARTLSKTPPVFNSWIRPCRGWYIRHISEQLLSSGVKLGNLNCFFICSSPDLEGYSLGTLCLCSCDGGCGGSLCVHSSGGREGEPGSQKNSPCWAPLRQNGGGYMHLYSCLALINVASICPWFAYHTNTLYDCVSAHADSLLLYLRGKTTYK